jgi:hypothetical protein
VNKVVWDLDRPLETDCTLELLKFEDEEAQAVSWTCSTGWTVSCIRGDELVCVVVFCVWCHPEATVVYDCDSGALIVNPENFGSGVCPGCQCFQALTHHRSAETEAMVFLSVLRYTGTPVPT